MADGDTPAPPRTRDAILALAASDPVALLCMTAEQVQALPGDAQQARVELLEASRAPVDVDDIAQIFGKSKATVATWQWRTTTGIPEGRVTSRYTHLPQPIPAEAAAAAPPRGSRRPGPTPPSYYLGDVVGFGLRHRMLSNRSYTPILGNRPSPGRIPNAEKATDSAA